MLALTGSLFPLELKFRCCHRSFPQLKLMAVVNVCKVKRKCFAESKNTPQHQPYMHKAQSKLIVNFMCAHQLTSGDYSDKDRETGVRELLCDILAWKQAFLFCFMLTIIRIIVCNHWSNRETF